jgi:HAD superfamily phosphatase (TIGR01668 family)
MYQKSVYTIDYKKLKNMGIRCILFDLDNTLITSNIKKPTRKIKDLIEKLKDMGFKIILFSNSKKKKLAPFKEKLEVDCASSCRKPLKFKFKKVIKEFKYSENEIAIIGDQLVTDILGGNRVGIYTILVDPIGKRDLIVTKLNRFLEKLLMIRLKKCGLLKKGNYYE